MNAPTKIKTKRCKICREPFIPRNTIQPTCFKFDCQLAYGIQAADKAKQRAEKIQRIELRERKESIKTRSQWIKETQIEFNKYIRGRDRRDACISCQRTHLGQYHAGHYRTVGSAPELRFNELNCHKQCSACNNYLSGNIINYRINLIKKIGLEQVEWLEGKHKPQKLTIDDIKAIKRKYQLAVKSLEAKQEPI